MKPHHLVLSVGLGLVVLACGQARPLERKPPYLAASTDTIDFGSIDVGEEDERTVFLINKGDKPLTLRSPTGDMEGGVFAIVPEAFEIPAGNEVLVRVHFAPAAEKEYLSVITFPNDSNNEPAFHLTVRGIGDEADPCKGKVCNAPPVPACLGTTTSRIYDPAGTCDAGQCVYSTVSETCGHGCDQVTGLCKGDPCASVICNSPPSACFNAIGQCIAGGCVYAPSNSAICNDNDPCSVQDACTEGSCRGTPKTCNQPPAAQCLDANTRRVWSSQGLCDGTGACQYTSQDQTCPYGCNGTTGTCNGDPCAGVTCNTPPNGCYAASGTCSNGDCTYAFANGASCNDSDPCTVSDACNAGSCGGQPKSCSAPPPAECVSGNTQLKQYSPVGTCGGGGTCSYASSTTSCQYGCEAGACKNEPTYGQDTIEMKLTFDRNIGTAIITDPRDIDLVYKNPVGGTCFYDAASPTWGNYGTATWSASPNNLINETIVHGAPKGGQADGNYRVIGRVWTVCEDPFICIGACFCPNYKETGTSVELRINGILKMTCTYEFPDNAKTGDEIEYAIVTRTNGFYSTITPSGAAGVVCTAH